MKFYKKIIRRALSDIGLVSIKTFREELSKWNKTSFPSGHYYSPIVDVNDIAETPISFNAEIPGIDLNESFQRNLLERLKIFYDENLFPHNKQEGCLYYFDNNYFGYSDGIFLNALMREYKPKRITEVGSGFSSALMIETNEIFFGGQIKLQFIEPFPEERLLRLIGDVENCVLLKEFVQNVPNNLWDDLEENDILFIDSSHVSKYQSDVNFIFFNVLPRLKPGVIIHVHDIFFPFEYPFQWIIEGRSWNEAYLLKAFLQYNNEFEIILYTSFLEGKYELWFQNNMPFCLRTHKKIIVNGVAESLKTTGQSIYLRRK